MAQSVPSRDLHRVVGACLIHRFKDGRGAPEVLITKRSENAKVYPGLWDVPGGGMERSDYEGKLLQDSSGGWENPLIGATRREIREEVGLEVGDLTFISHFTFIRPDDIPVLGMRFSAPYVSGEVRPDLKDAVDHAWITEKEIPNYRLLGKIPIEIRTLIMQLDARRFR